MKRDSYTLRLIKKIRKRKQNLNLDLQHNKFQNY